MAESQFGTASFEFYEGIRILLPGAIVAALYAAVSSSFFDRVSDFHGNQTLGVITLAVFAGLVAYFIDAPAKTAAFRENTPDKLLIDWGIQPPAGVRSVLNIYFVLLDELMPQSIRVRALYMGSIYRIGLELIYMLGATSIGVIATAGARAVVKRTSGNDIPAWFYYCFLIAGTLTFVWTIYSQVIRPPGKPSWIKVQRVLIDTLGQASSGWLGLPAAVLISAGSVLSIYFVYRTWQLVLITIGLTYWIWTVRYFRGYKSEKSGRFQHLDPPAAVLLFLIPAVLAGLYLWKSQREGISGLSTGTLGAWATAAIVTTVLIASRGHEKRLGGSYATQRTWLQYNKTTVMRIYGTSATGPAGSISEKR